MALKILPESVKAALARNFKPRRKAKARKPKVKLPEAVLEECRRQGRLGGLKAARNREASRERGIARIRKLCAEQGIDYDKLPDAPQK